MFQITDKPLNPQSIIGKVRKNAYGAVVTFVGTVRSPSQGKEVIHIDYEAYAEMALPKLKEIGQEIKERWGLENVAICHRVGRVWPGEIVTVIAVAASHRQEAFQACSYAIDRIKETVPIWKKEVFREGSRWVEGREPGSSPGGQTGNIEM